MNANAMTVLGTNRKIQVDWVSNHDRIAYEQAVWLLKQYVTFYWCDMQINVQ